MMNGQTDDRKPPEASHGTGKQNNVGIIINEASEGPMESCFKASQAVEQSLDGVFLTVIYG